MENLTGKIIHTSWGYDMTHNDWAKIIEDKGTPTVKCVRIAGRYLDGGGYTGNEIPVPEKEIGLPFRLHRRTGYQGQPSFVGSYPFIAGNDTSKRRGHFSLDEGKPRYYNTVD